MEETKLTPGNYPVPNFINGIPDEQVRQDSWTLFQIMSEIAQAIPRVWGTDIVGFGQYRAMNTEGKEEYWMLIGFAPRKKAIALYMMLSGSEHSAELLAKLGKYTHGKGCLYIKSLEDINLPVLKELIRESVASRAGPNPVPSSLKDSLY